MDDIKKRIYVSKHIQKAIYEIMVANRIIADAVPKSVSNSLMYCLKKCNNHLGNDLDTMYSLLEGSNDKK